GGGLQPEPHHRLVDRADLLDVERAVRDALAIENEELLERAVDRAVWHERWLEALVKLAAGPGRAALEEREAIRIEQDAMASGEPHLAPFRAVVNHPEQRQQLRPRAVALVHRVRKERRVLAQPIVEAGQRVIAHE